MSSAIDWLLFAQAEQGHIAMYVSADIVYWYATAAAAEL